MASQQDLLAEAHRREVMELNDKLRKIQTQLAQACEHAETRPKLIKLEDDSFENRGPQRMSTSNDSVTGFHRSMTEDTAAGAAEQDPPAPPLPPPPRLQLELMPGEMPSPPQEELPPTEDWRRKTLQGFSGAMGGSKQVATTPSGCPPTVVLPMSLAKSDNSDVSSFMPIILQKASSVESHDDVPGVPSMPLSDADSSEDETVSDGEAPEPLLPFPSANNPVLACRRLSRRQDLGIVADRLAGSTLPTADPIQPTDMTSPTGATAYRGSVATGGNASSYPETPPPRPRTTLAQAKSDQPWPLWLDVLANMGDDVVEVHKPPESNRGSALSGASSDRKIMLRRSHLHIKDTPTGAIHHLLRALVLHPSSEKRLIWVFSSFLFIMYDVVFIPLSTFDLDIDDFESGVAWIIAMYWTANLIVSTFMGYHDRFAVELRFQKTFMRYAKTWLMPDLFLVTIDWYIIVRATSSRNEASSARAVKSLYIARAFRLLRLVRVARLPSSLREATLFLMRSEYTSLSAGIVKHLAFILLINHFIACMWYTLGNDSKNGWVKQAKFLRSDDSWEMRYFTSLHWSLTQFTPASMEVTPQNLKERVFAVSVLVFAMVSFSSFVSSITNLMNHLRSLKSVESKQFAKLERYLQDNGISFALNMRVKRYLDHWISEAKRRPQEKDVEMLVKLSEPLRMEIHYESFRPILIRHPFFAHYEEMNMQAMRKLCHAALRSVLLSTGDDLFHNGEMAKAMYFVKSGELVYRRPFGHMTDKLEEGHWISEMVLWRPWEHVGTVTAITESSLMALDASSFHTIFMETQTHHKLSEEDAIAYAFKATEILAEVPPKDLTDLDDAEIYEASRIAHDCFSKEHTHDVHESEISAIHGGLLGAAAAGMGHLLGGGWMGHVNSERSGSKGKPDRNSGHRTSLSDHRVSLTRNSRRACEVEKACESQPSSTLVGAFGAVIDLGAVRDSRLRSPSTAAPQKKGGGAFARLSSRLSHRGSEGGASQEILPRPSMQGVSPSMSRTSTTMSSDSEHVHQSRSS